MSLFAGIMSGTSLDGVDEVILDVTDETPFIVATHSQKFPAELRTRLLKLASQTTSVSVGEASQLGVALAMEYAKATQEILQKANLTARDIRALGCHGQTLAHAPSCGYSLQLNQPSLLAEQTGIAVVADFRNRDIAAGGQGAPLACAFHSKALAHPQENRWVLNLGGMANVTRLYPDLPILGFDTGPANVLMDGWILRHRHLAYDDEGRFAATGRVLPELLKALLEHPYFQRPPPKSCGREEFSLDWLDQQLARLSGTQPGMQCNPHPTHHASNEDVAATLLELTAQSIASSIHNVDAHPQKVLVCGGGALNTHLMKRLQALMGSAVVTSTKTLGFDPCFIEAAAFAWLGAQTILGIPGNIPTVTGARGPRILGAIYPA